jgi:hypothetical protein
MPIDGFLCYKTQMNRSVCHNITTYYQFYPEQEDNGCNILRAYMQIMQYLFFLLCNDFTAIDVLTLLI